MVPLSLSSSAPRSYLSTHMFNLPQLKKNCSKICWDTLILFMEKLCSALYDIFLAETRVLAEVLKACPAFPGLSISWKWTICHRPRLCKDLWPNITQSTLDYNIALHQHCLESLLWGRGIQHVRFFWIFTLARVESPAACFIGYCLWPCWFHFILNILPFHLWFTLYFQWDLWLNSLSLHVNGPILIAASLWLPY